MTTRGVPLVRLPTVVVLAALVAGCFGGDTDPRASLVPYPRLGDVAVYEATGALVDFARWENGVPFAAASAQVRLTLAASPNAIDGARAVHPVFRVATEVAEAGVFDLRSERFVSPRQQAIVQSHHPLSQDQSVLAFDERGFPWLFGASALIGEELAAGVVVPFDLPDNLGRSQTFAAAWRVVGTDAGAWRLALEGLPGVAGELWLEPGSAWPTRARLSLTGPEMAPHIRSDGGYPVTMEARRVALTQGSEALPPRDRGATFAPDVGAARADWDGEKPPDGDITVISYPLADAVAEAKLLDKPLQDWLAAADSPILYRGTFQEEAGPVEGSTSALWLLQWVDRSDAYYEVQISKTFPPDVGLPADVPGVPQIVSSGRAEAPTDPNHGWFARDAVPEQLVPLSEGIRIVRDTFGATQVQIFLRSFADPPGYSYFLDGGFDGTPVSAGDTARPAGRVGVEAGGPGRYTVVYNPGTAFIEQATGPVSPRLI